MTTYVWFVRGAEHAAMCKTSTEAVLRADGSANILIMTDDIKYREYGIQATYFDSRGAPIMLANLEAQCQALFAPASNGKFVFLDTDVLLLGEIPQVGQLTVTWRDSVYASEEGEKVSGVATTMPYNYGVIAATFSQPTIEAFTWMRERVRKMQDSQQQWYGNQLALAELCGPRPVVGTSVGVRQIPWLLHEPSTFLSVGKIPCELYNYTPQAVGEDVGKRYALHFKGKARGLMKGYAEQLGLGWWL